MRKKISDKKQKQIDTFLATSLRIGEHVYFNNNYGKKASGVVQSIDGGEVAVKRDEAPGCLSLVNISDIQRNTFDIGANPFSDANNNVFSKLYRLDNDIEGILYYCGWDRIKLNDRDEINGINVGEMNFSPYIFDKDGNKQYYQRDYIWGLKEKQMLINSIYNYLDCGKIVIRKRSWEYIETETKKGNQEVYYMDIVDGKQRISCLMEFVEDGFPDSQGNYFSDLSDRAQVNFRRSKSFTLLTLNEKCTDEDVIQTFLLVNFSGIQCSQEHLDYVRGIYQKMK